MAISEDLIRDYAAWAHVRQERRTRLPEHVVPGGTRPVGMAEAATIRAAGGTVLENARGEFGVPEFRTIKGTEYVHDSLASYTLEDVLEWLAENAGAEPVGVYRRAGGINTDPHGSYPMQEWLTLDDPSEARQLDRARTGSRMVASVNVGE